MRALWLTDCSSISGAFSGLLAYAITLMDGMGGLSGWQWIFILEGIVTVVAGVVSIFTIFNGPESVSWLTDEEKRYMKVKLAYDGNRSGMGNLEGGPKSKFIKDAFRDWQVSVVPRTCIMHIPIVQEPRANGPIHHRYTSAWSCSWASPCPPTDWSLVYPP